MKVIIAGSRSITDPKIVEYYCRHMPYEMIEMVCGMCPDGVDKIAYDLYKDKIPIKEFPADWSKGKPAGPFRNRQMAYYADALVAIWDGKSRGTRDMIRKAHERGLPYTVYRHVF